MRTDDPVLLTQAKQSLAEILGTHYRTSESESVVADDRTASGVDRAGGVPADQVAGWLAAAWKTVPVNAPPVLSLVSGRCLPIALVFLA